MKIYIVLSEDNDYDSDVQIVEVFQDEQRAENFSKEMNEKSRFRHYEVQEWQVTE